MAFQSMTGYQKHLAVLTVVVLSIYVHPTESILGSTSANKCDYPGLAVAVNDAGAILCTGLRVMNEVLLPFKCSLILNPAVLKENWHVKSSGFQWDFNTGTDPGGYSHSDGTYRISLTNADRNQVVDSDELPTESCFTSLDVSVNFPRIFTEGFNGVLYDGSEALITSSCVVVGYGASVNDGAQYMSNNLKQAPITKSLSVPCCAAVFDTITAAEEGIGMLTNDTPLNCVVSSGAPCGLGDLGAPVMCKTTSGKTVAIGLTASSPCVAGGLFLIQDLTGASSKTKFGVKSITATAK